MTPSVALRLGRVSNLPTVWTNALAGVALAGASPWQWAVLPAALGLSLAYLGGMYLNDAFDSAIDARERAVLTAWIPEGTARPSDVRDDAERVQVGAMVDRPSGAPGLLRRQVGQGAGQPVLGHLRVVILNGQRGQLEVDQDRVAGVVGDQHVGRADVAVDHPVPVDRGQHPGQPEREPGQRARILPGGDPRVDGSGDGAGLVGQHQIEGVDVVLTLGDPGQVVLDHFERRRRTGAHSVCELDDRGRRWLARTRPVLA